MGDKVSIEVKKRDVYGKKVARLRQEGLTPVVIYGHGIEPTAAQVDTLVMARVYAEASFHTPVEIILNGKKHLTMIKGVDMDHVKHNLRHVSFHAIKQNQPVETEVAVRLIGGGESEAEKAGLVVLQALDRVEIKALPKDLPEAIEVNILGLKEVGDKVTLADAKLPEGVEFIEREREVRQEDEDEERPRITDLMVASAYEPAALQAANEAAAGEASEETVEEETEAETSDEEAPAEE